MALATEPTYSTFEQFQTYTPVVAQQDNSFQEDDWKPFALRAERIIDAIVNVPENQKFDSDQNLKFPITGSDGTSWIPDEITLAHIEITADLILKGDLVATSDYEATSEDWSGSGYSVTKQKKTGSSSDDSKILIPPFALKLLQPWTSKVAPLKY